MLQFFKGRCYRTDKKDQPELLEYIRCKVGCMYISDLHQECWFPEIQKIICRISPEMYSLKEWNDAVNYITGAQQNFETRTMVVDFLKNYKKPRF